MINCLIGRKKLIKSHFLCVARGKVEFLLEKKGKVVPVEVKASNASTASLNGLLERDDIEFGYKFTSGNVGVAGKKITLPHYMMMFI